jgi:hypothetical protein
MNTIVVFVCLVGLMVTAGLVNNEYHLVGPASTTIVNDFRSGNFTADGGVWNGSWNATVLALIDGEVVPQDFSYQGAWDANVSALVDSGVPSRFVVLSVGDTAYLKDGITGSVSYSSTNKTKPIVFALGNLTAGRVWKEKVTLMGNFSNLHPFSIPSYSVLEGGALLKCMPNMVGSDFVHADGATQVEVCGLTIDGNSANQGVDMNTFAFNSCTDSIIHHCRVFGGHRGATTNGEGIKVYLSSACIVSENTCITSKNCYDLIKISRSNSSIVIGNTIDALSTFGNSTAIQVALGGGVAYYNVVANNVYRGCLTHENYAIKLHSACYTTVVGNSIVGATYGIDLIQNANNNLVYGNTVCLKLDGVGVDVRAVVNGTDKAYRNSIVSNQIFLSNTAGAKGICVWPNGVDTKISHNFICGGSALDFGIKIEVGATGTYVWDNDVSNNALNVEISDLGTGSVIHFNRGYRTLDMVQVLYGGTTADLSTSAAYQYVEATALGGVDTSAAARRSVVSRNGTVKNAFAYVSVAPGAGANRTFTLYKNSAPTSIVIIISGASATTGWDTVHSVSLVTGDVFVWYCTLGGTPAAASLKINLDFYTYPDNQ